MTEILPPTVTNRHYETFDIYIGRGTIWGNPFRTSDDIPREEVIAKHKQYLWEQIKKGEITLEDLKSLSGKKLGCSCKPRACHGDSLVAAWHWAITQ